jgi:hypothetical protein
MSRTEQMTEPEKRLVAEAEADLQQLLSIEPSPEFAAKVRTRIHEQRERRTTRWGWIGLAIAAAAALILVAVLRTHDSAAETQDVEVVRLPDTLLPASVPMEHRSTAVTIAAHAAAVGKQSTNTVETGASPEVIIDPAMTSAIQRLAAGARNTILDGSNGESIAADAHAGALPVAEPLKVPELVVSPADPNGGQ